MFKDVLKTLSDTEIMVIAKEINDPNVSNDSIIKQLISKSDSILVLDRSKILTDKALLTLCMELSLEMCNRLSEKDSI